VTGTPTAFTYPAGHFDFLVDFATPSAAEVGAGGTAIAKACLNGTTNLLRFARQAKVRRMLYASSGAVYGPQPAHIERLAEGYVCDPSLLSPYGHLKRETETMVLESGIECVIARGFAFIGPYLPLTDKFAAGSFLRDALSGGPIRIRGDGSPIRSYLYGADLAVWLTVMLAHGHPGCAYNIGSDRPISLNELAFRIAATIPSPCNVNTAGGPLDGADRYLPDINRAAELGLHVAIELNTALERFALWADTSWNPPGASV